MRLALLLAAVSGAVLASEASKLRLPGDVIPLRYELDLSLDPAKDSFNGSVVIQVQVKQAVPVIWLNSKELTIQSAGVAGVPAKVVASGSEVVGLESPVRPGRARIELRFSGSIRKVDVQGLFKQREGAEWYIFSQFDPISARLAFPCFDEPGWKTPWRLTLRVPKGLGAFTNSPVESDTVRGDTRIVQFRESKPMPTYLVALAVGAFDVIDGGTAGTRKTPLRIVATRGHPGEARFATEITPKVFRALEEYFGTPYPYEKLDQVTIPTTVGFGAMENAGLITYSAPILLMRAGEDAVSRRRATTRTITHELAHQWFGNLVTPAWWDDVWLNEGFATWMSERILERLFPEWKEDLTAVNGKNNIMAADTLLSARKIRQPIETTGDITGVFDPIAYRKGSAVIRMFENYVGAEAFRKAIKLHMRRHAWGSATAADLMRSITDASGKDVAAAFSTFLDRTGTPLLTVNLNCTAGIPPSLSVSQQRLLPLGSNGSAGEQWQIPMCLAYEGGDTVVRECHMLRDAKAVVTLRSASACPTWLNANDGGVGYYRVQYDSPTANRLVANIEKLDLRDRVEFLNNTTALLAAGRMPADEALELVPQFQDAQHPELVLGALRLALSVGQSVPEDLKPNYSRFMNRMFRDRARQLGLMAKPGEPENVQPLRAELVKSAARFGDDGIVAEARRIASKWLVHRKAVSRTDSALALEVTSLHGDRAWFNTLVAELRKSEDARDQAQIIGLIGAIRDPELALRALQLILEPSLDVRQTARLLRAFNREPETATVAWQYMVSHYDALVARLPSVYGSHPGATLPTTGEGFCSAEGYTQVESFFRDRVKSMPGAERPFASVLESIRLCEARRDAQSPRVATFLARW